jgi:hypothetical protein
MKHIYVGILGFVVFVLIWQLLKTATPLDVAMAVAVGAGVAIVDWITEAKEK